MKIYITCHFYTCFRFQWTVGCLIVAVERQGKILLKNNYTMVQRKIFIMNNNFFNEFKDYLKIQC